MSIDFDKLNEMVDSIANVIEDVKKETENITNNLYSFRQSEYNKVYSDLKKCADIAYKTTGINKSLRINVDELGVKICFQDKKVGLYRLTPYEWDWEGWLKADVDSIKYNLEKDNSAITYLVERWDELGDSIMENFALKLQEIIKEKADKAHKELNDVKHRAFELGYMSAEEM